MFTREFMLLGQALQAYQELVSIVIRYFTQDVRLVPVYSTRILRVTAELYSGCLLMEQALVAQRKLSELPVGHHERPFYEGKVQGARFYVRNMLPDVMATVQIVKEADTSAMDVPEEAF